MTVKLAYLAGIIDGEGTITLEGRSRSAFRRPAVSVANTDKGLIDWLTAEFGGSVRVRNGRVSHYKILYEWRIRDEPAVQLLRRVRRYLRIKRPRADLICADWSTVRKLGGVYSEGAKASRLAFEASVLAL